MIDGRKEFLSGSFPNGRVVILTDGDKLTCITKLFDSIDSLGVESTKFDKWNLDGLLLLNFICLFLIFFIVNNFSLNFKTAKDTSFSAHNQRFEALGIVNVSDIFGNVTLSDCEI